MFYIEIWNFGRPRRTGLLPVPDLDFQSVCLNLLKAYAIWRGSREESEDGCAGYRADLGTEVTSGKGQRRQERRLVFAIDAVASQTDRGVFRFVPLKGRDRCNKLPLGSGQMVFDEDTYHRRPCFVLVPASPCDYHQCSLLLAK